MEKRGKKRSEGERKDKDKGEEGEEQYNLKENNEE